MHGEIAGSEIGASDNGRDVEPPRSGGWKSRNRDKLLSAAQAQFCQKGLFNTSIDDIVLAAGFSRMTFYRHFPGKSEILGELYKRENDRFLPRVIEIKDLDFRDQKTVKSWISKIVSQEETARDLHIIFAQASRIDERFREWAEAIMEWVTISLGEKIPAFAAPDRRRSIERLRWLEARLIVYEILDQVNQRVQRFGIARDELIITVLAERFIQFVMKYDRIDGQEPPTSGESREPEPTGRCKSGARRTPS